MLSDEEIALAYCGGRMRCYGDNKEKELAGRRAIEAEVRKEQAERIAELESQLAEARKALTDIGDFAHDKSTGPAVPDALWEIRAMAYTAAEPAIKEKT